MYQDLQCSFTSTISLYFFYFYAKDFFLWWSCLQLSSHVSQQILIFLWHYSLIFANYFTTILLLRLSDDSFPWHVNMSQLSFIFERHNRQTQPAPYCEAALLVFPLLHPTRINLDPIFVNFTCFLHFTAELAIYSTPGLQKFSSWSFYHQVFAKNKSFSSAPSLVPRHLHWDLLTIPWSWNSSPLAADSLLHWWLFFN